MKECWYKNMTSSDLNLSDLGIRIPADSSINLFKLKPTLTSDLVKKSEEEGLLSKCVNFKPRPKLVKLPCAPSVDIVKSSLNNIKEALKPIPSRVKTSILVDPKEKDYIEDMEEDNIRLSDIDVSKYVNYSEGIIDPIAVESENSTFKTIAISSKDDVVPAEKNSVAEQTKVNTIGLKGKNQYFTIDLK